VRTIRGFKEFGLSLLALSGVVDGQSPTEVSSGVTFPVSYRSLEGGGHPSQLYSWACIDPGSPFHILGLAISVKSGPQCGTAGRFRCASWYVSRDGGKIWCCQSLTLPDLPAIVGTPQPAATYAFVADPTASYDNWGSYRNNAYATWLVHAPDTVTPPLPESRVYMKRLIRPATLPPPNPPAGCDSWDPELPVVFDPPVASIGGVSYGVDKPFLAIDQNLTSTYLNRMYVAAAYWVPFGQMNPCEWPSNTYIYCRTGNASPPPPPANNSWTTFNGPSPASVPPFGAPCTVQPSSPGGVLVSDHPPGSPPNRELDAPYVAVAQNGWVYIAWIELAANVELTSGIIWIDRSIDGGLTWGLEGIQLPDYNIHNIPRVAHTVRTGMSTVAWANSHPKIAIDRVDPNLVHVVWTEKPEIAQGLAGDADIKYKSVRFAPPGVKPPIPPPLAVRNIRHPGQQPVGRRSSADGRARSVSSHDCDRCR